MVKDLESELPETPDMIEQLYREENKEFIAGYKAALEDLQCLMRGKNFYFYEVGGHGRPEKISTEDVIKMTEAVFDKRIKEEGLKHE